MKTGSYAGRLRKRFVFSDEHENSFGFQGVTSELSKEVKQKLNEISTRMEQREQQKLMNKQPVYDLDAVMLPADAAGELLGLSGMRIRQLAQQGHIERKGKTYPLVSVVKGYIAFLSNAKPSKASADAKIREMKAAEIEQRMAERAKELVHIDDVTAELAAFVASVRAEISSIPALITRDKVERKKYESLIDGVLKRISERQSKASEAIKADGDADDAIEEDTA